MAENEHVSYLEKFCAEKGHRLTPPRRHVFDIIKTSKAPLTAYDVLDALKGCLNDPKPPTAYRALEFLAKEGLIHRIESLNAYVACSENHTHRGSQFLICEICGSVEEAHMCHVPDGLKKLADKKGFAISYWNAELHGICSKCR